MRDKAQEWLCKQIRKARIAQGHAENRPGVTQEELENLQNKVDVLDWLLEMIGCSSGSRWICVRDRLPEEETEVLCYLGNALGKGIVVAFRRHGDWYFDGWKCPTVTHWMPLPAPPKEETE